MKVGAVWVSWVEDVVTERGGLKFCGDKSNFCFETLSLSLPLTFCGFVPESSFMSTFLSSTPSCTRAQSGLTNLSLYCSTLSFTHSQVRFDKRLRLSATAILGDLPAMCCIGKFPNPSRKDITLYIFP